MAARNLCAFALFLLSMALVSTAMSQGTGASDEIYMDTISATVVLKSSAVAGEGKSYEVLKFTYSNSIRTDDGLPWCHLGKMRIWEMCGLSDQLNHLSGLKFPSSSDADNSHYSSFPAHSFECELTDLSDEYWRLSAVHTHWKLQPEKGFDRTEFSGRDEYELILTKNSRGDQWSSFPTTSSRVISYSGRSYWDNAGLDGLHVEDHRPLAKQRVRDSDVGVLTLECPYIRFPLVGR